MSQIRAGVEKLAVGGFGFHFTLFFGGGGGSRAGIAMQEQWLPPNLLLDFMSKDLPKFLSFLLL